MFFKVAKTVSTMSAALRWEISNLLVTDKVSSFRVTFFLFMVLKIDLYGTLPFCFC